jgi:ATP-binding cassette, subfamily B, bacterial
LSVSDEQILDVTRELGMSTWLDSLRNGLDTALEAGGTGLSGGESQLLAFGRVFLKNPGLVILDEPSSRLDPATEKRLSRAVDRLLEHRTGIVIAHRLQTVERVDRILVMADGRVVEFGRREELARDPQSRYSQLVAMSEGKALDEAVESLE